MFKYFIVFLKIGWYLIFSYPKLLIYSLNKDRISYEKRYKFAMRFFRILAWGFGIKYELVGVDAINKDENICLCPNHQAFLDPLIISTNEMVDRRFLIIAKKESSKFFYVGRIEKMMEVMFIDREDFRKSLQTMKAASARLAKGDQNMLIFLEGTRSKNENYKMNEFKPGGLKPAYENHLTFVPVAMTGYNTVLTGKNNKLSHKVHVEFLKPIPYEEYKDMNTIELAKYMQDLVSARVDELMKQN